MNRLRGPISVAPLLLCGALVVSSGCGFPPSDVPPAWCESHGAPQVSCDGANCVAAIVIDYERLEPRGYRVLSLAKGTAVSALEAEAIADKYLVEHLGQQKADATECRRGGLDFHHCDLVYKSRNRYLIIVHAHTGQVLFAQPELWAAAASGRGKDAALPKGFSGPRAIGCVDEIAKPDRLKLVTTGQPLASAPASTDRQAFDVARKLNVTKRFVGDHDYRAFVISYAPARAEFDPGAADWYVWLQRLPL